MKAKSKKQGVRKRELELEELLGGQFYLILGLENTEVAVRSETPWLMVNARDKREGYQRCTMLFYIVQYGDKYDGYYEIRNRDGMLVGKEHFFQPDLEQIVTIVGNKTKKLWER
jgi:hypothetical protein